MTRLFGDGDNSIWKKIGQDALETAVKTLVEEGIEATVEIWKKRRLKIQEEELEEMAAAAEEASVQAPDPGERKEYPGGESGDGEASTDEPVDEEPVEEAPEEDDQEAAGFPTEQPATEARRSVESFRRYVAKEKYGS